MSSYYLQVGDETPCMCDTTLSSTAFTGTQTVECPTHSTVPVDDDFFAVSELAGFPVMVAPDDFLEFLADSGYGGGIDIKEFMDLFYDWLED